MGFVKVLKNKAYSKRYQTKFRRRRQGKTDYYARKRLVVNDKNKYDSKKYRLVVRFTNKRVICSINYSTLKGDMTVAAADSSELKGFGVTCGLTNYASAYATGLLLARRLLKDKKMDGMKGVTKADGKLYNIADEDTERRPFKAYLDVGLVRTTTGNRVFGAMKGACDGGLNVPHSVKRFPGYTRGKIEEVVNKRGKATGEVEKTEAGFEAGVLRDYIFGNHVNKYMNALKKEDPGKFKRQFSAWEKCLAENKCKNTEDLYKAVHKKILADSGRKKAAGNAKPTRKMKETGNARVYTNSKKASWLRHRKMTGAERKAAVAAKFAALMQ